MDFMLKNDLMLFGKKSKVYFNLLYWIIFGCAKVFLCLCLFFLGKLKFLVQCYVNIWGTSFPHRWCWYFWKLVDVISDLMKAFASTNYLLKGSNSKDLKYTNMNLIFSRRINPRIMEEYIEYNTMYYIKPWY